MPNDTSGTLVAARFTLPYMVERGTYTSLSLPLRGVIPSEATVTTTVPIPSGSTITIYDPAGNSVLSESVLSPESATHTFTVPDSWRLASGYEVEWSYQTNLGGGRHETSTFRNEAIVCRRILYCPISDNDVYAVVSSLDPNGTKPIHGATSLNRYVNEAWTRIQRRLIEQGNRPNLILSPSSLHDVSVLLTLALVFEDFSTRLNTAYMEQARMYREQYETAWGRLSFSYADGDGTTGGTTRRRSASSSVFLGTTRGPN